jgi:DNA-binding CsgD family transcriptional regulator
MKPSRTYIVARNHNPHTGKKPTDEQVLESIREGLTKEQMAAKYSRSLQYITNRVADVMYLQAIKKHQAAKEIEAEISPILKISHMSEEQASLTIGEVFVTNGRIYDIESQREVKV